MKNFKKLLFASIILMSTWIMQAVSSPQLITNTTTSSLTGFAWVFANGSVSQNFIFNPGNSLEIPSSCSAVMLSLNQNKKQAGSSTLIKTTLKPNTSYNLILASDGVTFMLSPTASPQTITNTTKSGLIGHKWLYDNGSISNLFPSSFNPGNSLIIPSSCSAVMLPLNQNKNQAGNGTLISTTLQPNTSYNLILAPDGVTCMLSPITSQK